MVTDELFLKLLAVVTSLAQGETARGGSTHLWNRCDEIKTAVEGMRGAGRTIETLIEDPLRGGIGGNNDSHGF